jgi:hypothetical protein
MPDYPPLAQMGPRYDPAAADAFPISVLGRLADLAKRGFMAPGQALASTTPITSEQMIMPAQQIQSLMMGGAPMAERGAVGAFGGRLASTTGDELVSNLARAPAAAANEVAPFMRESPGSYQGAVRQQQIQSLVSRDAHVGDINYWRDLANKENITTSIDKTRPNPMAAARKYSEDGKTTMLIRSNGQRIVYRNGEQVVSERMMDLPKE